MTIKRPLAIEYPPGSGTYQDLANTTDYQGGFPAAGDFSLSVSNSFDALPGSGAFLRSISPNARQIPLTLIRKGGGSTDAETFQSNVTKWFHPHNGKVGWQYLKVMGEDGTTELRVATLLSSRAPRPNAVDTYDLILDAVSPNFEALTESNAVITTSGTAENLGNARAQVRLSLAGSAISGHKFTVTDNSGRGLRNHPMVFDSTTTRTQAQCFLWVNGVLRPFTAGQSSRYFVALISTEPSGTCEVHIAYDTGLTNSLAGKLNMGPGVSFRGTTPDLMQWNAILVDGSPQDQNGTWYPAQLNLYGQDLSQVAFTMENNTIGDGTKITLRTTGLGGSSNALVCDLGVKAGTSSALTNLERILSGFASDVIAYVAYQTANSDRWRIAWSSSTNATVTTAIDLDGAVRIAVGIEPNGAAPTDGSALEVGINGAVNVAFDTNDSPDIATETYDFDLLSGAVSNTTTGQSITFTGYLYPDGTLEINTSERLDLRQAKPSVQGPVAGSYTWSDSTDLFSLDPGENTITEAVNGSVTVAWRDTYS